jgi:hypothetical protein
MKNIEDLMQICQKKISEGSDTEEILSYLRKMGCSKGTCITILLKLNYLPLEKAQFTKYVVHFSKTWEDLRETHEDWHDRILEILDKTDV